MQKILADAKKKKEILKLKDKGWKELVIYLNLSPDKQTKGE